MSKLDGDHGLAAAIAVIVAFNTHQGLTGRESISSAVRRKPVPVVLGVVGFLLYHWYAPLPARRGDPLRIAGLGLAAVGRHRSA